MIGGKVINVVQLPACTWVQCHDERSGDVCAIRVERNQAIQTGDDIWWQSGFAYWTPTPSYGRQDVRLKRIGYSHATVSDDVMERMAV